MTIILVVAALCACGAFLAYSDRHEWEVRFGVGMMLALLSGITMIALCIVLIVTFQSVPSVVAKHKYLSDLSSRLPTLGQNAEDAIGEIVKFNTWLADEKAWNRGVWDIFHPDEVCDLPLIDITKAE